METKLALPFKEIIQEDMMTRKYCRAYHLKDLRAFRDWAEKHDENEAELSGDNIVYLWDDLTVVKSPVIPDKGLIFDAVTPEWQDFCTTTLNFEIPEDLRYAYEQAESRAEKESDVEQSPASV
ncbi:hypothetical protein [Ktedonobacter sp. SOSP1-52]|uniref:hypothetical protein n=1 Tax=Ktedonobacter sp. SOSP1-52 TaxID=2778366 RepID=UPI0019161A5F|nr:hypothetical protein [Ktedonobacter sp. SOSP1-52]